MPQIQSGRSLLRSLQQTLGLSDLCSRVVIDIPANGVAKVYQVNFMDDQQAASLQKVLDEVNIELIDKE